IDPKVLTVALTGNLDKVYNGNSNATLTAGNYLLSGFVGTERATIIQTTGNYNSKNVADADTVTATLSGNSFAADYGTLLSNYVLPATASGTGHITPRGITVDATAGNKVYDATTNGVVALGSSGVLAGDSVVLTGTGHFADKNVGTAKAVTVDIDASGTDAGNYAFHAASGTTADIAPATLVYQADPATFQLGQAWGSLGGTVSGLVGGETLADATDGTLAWQTPADSTSTAGTYAIDGSGLSALNYVFVQAADNATALHLIGNDTPSLVASTVAGLQQVDDADEARAPYAPDVRIVNGGVGLP
ncbi:MAG TPA: YDG domain-containing protein, partial [Rhodanobacter sp.]|nr:YDG domain-containing protein [Rhodanobacter sp.]